MDNRIDIFAIECQFSPDQGLLAQKYPPSWAGITMFLSTKASPEHPLHYGNRTGKAEKEDVAQASVAYEALLLAHLIGSYLLLTDHYVCAEAVALSLGAGHHGCVLGVQDGAQIVHLVVCGQHHGEASVALLLQAGQGRAELMHCEALLLDELLHAQLLDVAHFVS